MIPFSRLTYYEERSSIVIIDALQYALYCAIDTVAYIWLVAAGSR